MCVSDENQRRGRWDWGLPDCYEKEFVQKFVKWRELYSYLGSEYLEGEQG